MIKKCVTDGTLSCPPVILRVWEYGGWVSVCRLVGSDWYTLERFYGSKHLKVSIKKLFYVFSWRTGHNLDVLFITIYVNAGQMTTCTPETMSNSYNIIRKSFLIHDFWWIIQVFSVLSYFWTFLKAQFAPQNFCQNNLVGQKTALI